MSKPIILYSRSALLAKFFQSELKAVSNFHFCDDGEQLEPIMRAYPEARLFIDGRDLPRDIYGLLNSISQTEPALGNPVTLIVQQGTSSKLPAYRQAFTGFDVLEKPLTSSQLNDYMDNASDQPLTNNNNTDSKARTSPGMPVAGPKAALPFPSSPPVQEYFVWDGAGRHETASSLKAEQLEDAMSYSMSICQRLAEENGWGDFYEIHGYSNDQACAFFSVDMGGQLKTYGVLMSAQTSMQDFIAASRSRAARQT